MARKGSVLVVDDEEIMRDVLETLLSSEGYRVDLAKTGEEGLDAYTRRSYDVVLLDVSMPGIGGLRALEEFLKLDAEADRKSTRLNSSHVAISYAVFCLKKKK